MAERHDAAEADAAGVSGTDTVAVFARAPVLGQVKTRLARTLGNEAALAAHEELVATTLGRVTGSGDFELELWVAGDLEHPLVQQWSHEFGVPVINQQGADLGARMAGAFERLTQRAGRVLVIGCDCPGINLAYIGEALAALADHDLVLGPAEDGGYGLIGSRGHHPALFHNVPWGTDRVLGVTLALAGDLGLSFALLDLLWDVDTAADWARYLAER